MALYGEYVVVVEQKTGVELARFALTATTGHPQAGDQVEIDQKLYQVAQVRHVPDPDGSSSRRPMVAQVHVRLNPSALKRLAPEPPPGALLPFQAPPSTRPVASDLLPPQLIALLVLAGYELLARSYLQTRPTGSAKQKGQTWHVFDGQDGKAMADRALRHASEVREFVIKHLEGRLPSLFERGTYRSPSVPTDDLPTLSEEEGATVSERGTPRPGARLHLVKDKPKT